MKYVQINSVPNGSTGAVMRQIHQERVEAGDQALMLWGGRGRRPQKSGEGRYGSYLGNCFDALQTRLDGRAGFHSSGATMRLVLKLDKMEPDVVHLHNLHGYHIDVELLFDWLSRKDCRVIWTLHDCWAFTGHCAYFSHIGCEKWKDGCKGDCPLLGEYPKTRRKGSNEKNWKAKKELFTLLPPERLILVTPSQWLADLVGQSFLSKYPVVVAPNKVDTEVFKPTESDFREKHGLVGKKVVLGVASPWSPLKGFDDFAQVAEKLPEGYVAVAVGLAADQQGRLPAGSVGLGRVDSPSELARIYSAADVLFNPSHADNYPMVPLEAQACGTPVVTYDVGGCAETLSMPQSRAIPVDPDKAVEAIIEVCEAGK